MPDRKMIAAEMAALKAKVKAEMQRRKHNGDMTAYAAAAYDYAAQPTVGTQPLAEHFNKLRDPLAAVNPAGMPDQAPRVATETDMVALEARLALLQAKAVVGGTNDCAALCSGMCVTACSTGCTSCTSCTSCTNCTGGCSSCSGGCDGCSGCDGSCDGCYGCGSDCSSSCGNGGCGGGCHYNCMYSTVNYD